MKSQLQIRRGIHMIVSLISPLKHMLSLLILFRGEIRIMGVKKISRQHFKTFFPENDVMQIVFLILTFLAS